MPKDAAPTEADIIFNRANVALARSQSLIQSWLPSKTPEEQAASKSEQQLLKEDEELFKPTPELLGLGAVVPDADPNKLPGARSSLKNDQLLEKLLGKKAAKGHRAASKPKPAQNTALNPKPRPEQNNDDDSDEEGGRASMVTSNSAARRKPNIPPKPKAPQIREKAQSDQDSSDEGEKRPTKKRPATFMDELLASKASKKKKKQNA